MHTTSNWIGHELASLPSAAVVAATTAVNATFLTFDDTLRLQIEALVGSPCDNNTDAAELPSTSNNIDNAIDDNHETKAPTTCIKISDYPSWVVEEIAALKRPWNTSQASSVLGTKYRNTKQCTDSETRGRVVLAIPHESMCAGSLIRRIASLFYLLQGWKRQLAPIRQALTLARLRAVVRLAKHFVALRTRVQNMDVQAFNSGVIQYKLDLLKFAAPRPPAATAIQCVRHCLRGWVCRRRIRLHNAGIRAYPVQQVRYSRGSSGFTWVNPKHRRRWGHLIAMNNTLPSRIANKPTRGHGPPQQNDWVHCMLTGRYVLSDNAAEKRGAKYMKSHRDRVAQYRECMASRDWYRLAKTAWKYEYHTYHTENFYHDYHMGDILDAVTRRPLCQSTRARRDASHIYRTNFLHNIEVYEERMARRKK